MLGKLKNTISKKLYGDLYDKISNNAVNYIFILSFFIFLLILILRISLIFSYSTNLGGTEHYVIFGIQRIISGQSLYSNPEDGQMFINGYAPFYYYIVGYICKLFNLKAGYDLLYVYKVARAINIVFNLLTMMLLYRLMYLKFLINKKIAFIYASLAFIQLTPHFFSSRPDSLCSLLMMLSIYTIVHYCSKIEINRANNPYGLLFLSILLIEISFFTKQNGIQLAVIMLLFFVLNGLWREFIWSLTLFILITSSILFIFNQFYGYSFYQNVVLSLKRTEFDIVYIYKVWTSYYYEMGILLFVSIFLIFKYLNPTYNYTVKFLSTCMAGMLGFAIIALTFKGSDINYFNDYINISYIAIALFTNSIFNTLKNEKQFFYSKQFSSLLLLFFLLLLPNILMNRYFHSFHFKTELKKRYINEYKTSIFIRKELTENQNEYVFTNNSTLNNLLFDKCVLPSQDVISLGTTFNYYKFSEYINNGRVKYLILNMGQQPSPYLGATFTNFEHFVDLNGFSVYVFKKRH